MAGATAGGLSAAWTGGDVGKGMLQGAAMGALSGAAFGALGTPDAFWKIPAYGITGGALSLISDRNFIEGALFALTIASASYIFTEYTGANANGETAKKNGYYDPIVKRPTTIAGNLEYSQAGYNILGGANCPGPLCEKSAFMSWLGKNVPFFQNMGLFHDDITEMPLLKTYLNIPSIAPALGFTFVSGAGYYAPLSSTIWFNIDEKKK